MTPHAVARILHRTLRQARKDWGDLDAACQRKCNGQCDGASNEASGVGRCRRE